MEWKPPNPVGVEPIFFLKFGVFYSNGYHICIWLPTETKLKQNLTLFFTQQHELYYLILIQFTEIFLLN